MNKILRYVMSLLSVMVMSLPLQAQVVIDNTEQETKEEEPADDKDELAVSDSLMVDSLEIGRAHV